MKIGKKQKTAYGAEYHTTKITPKQELIDSMKNIISSTTFAQTSNTVSDFFPKQSVFMSSTTFTLHCFVVLSVLITAAALVVLPRVLKHVLQVTFALRRPQSREEEEASVLITSHIPAHLLCVVEWSCVILALIFHEHFGSRLFLETCSAGDGGLTD